MEVRFRACRSDFVLKSILVKCISSTAATFTNSRGQSIDAKQQVDALTQAQSIVYLSIFICQAFNVIFPF